MLQHSQSRPSGASGEGTFSISDLAAEFGVTTRTLRHYESQGIVSPQRHGTRRLYSRRDRGRLKLALQGRQVGFTLSEIREMLDLYDLRDGAHTQLRFSLGKFRDRIGQLQAQRRAVDAAIADLTRTCDRIEVMLTADDEGTGGVTE